MALDQVDDLGRLALAAVCLIVSIVAASIATILIVRRGNHLRSDVLLHQFVRLLLESPVDIHLRGIGVAHHSIDAPKASCNRR